MFDLKKIGIVAFAGALTGIGAAVNVDRAEFASWLKKENLGNLFANISKFEWRVALKRYAQGAVGGAVAAVAGVFGVPLLGVDLPAVGV